MSVCVCTPRRMRSSKRDASVLGTEPSCIVTRQSFLLIRVSSKVMISALVGGRCPCLKCTIKIVQTGVKEVVYNLSYKMSDIPLIDLQVGCPLTCNKGTVLPLRYSSMPGSNSDNTLRPSNQNSPHQKMLQTLRTIKLTNLLIHHTVIKYIGLLTRSCQCRKYYTNVAFDIPL